MAPAMPSVETDDKPEADSKKKRGRGNAAAVDKEADTGSVRERANEARPLQRDLCLLLEARYPPRTLLSFKWACETHLRKKLALASRRALPIRTRALPSFYAFWACQKSALIQTTLPALSSPYQPYRIFSVYRSGAKRKDMVECFLEVTLGAR